MHYFRCLKKATLAFNFSSAIASCVYFIHLFCVIFRSIFHFIFWGIQRCTQCIRRAHTTHCKCQLNEKKTTIAKRYLQFRFKKYGGSKTMKNLKRSRCVYINKPYLWMRWITPTSQLENTFFRRLSGTRFLSQRCNIFGPVCVFCFQLASLFSFLFALAAALARCAEQCVFCCYWCCCCLLCSLFFFSIYWMLFLNVHLTQLLLNVYFFIVIIIHKCPRCFKHSFIFCCVSTLTRFHCIQRSHIIYFNIDFVRVPEK